MSVPFDAIVSVLVELIVTLTTGVENADAPPIVTFRLIVTTSPNTGRKFATALPPLVVVQILESQETELPLAVVVKSVAALAIETFNRKRKSTITNLLNRRNLATCPKQA